MECFHASGITSLQYTASTELDDNLAALLSTVVRSENTILRKTLQRPSICHMACSFTRPQAVNNKCLVRSQQEPSIITRKHHALSSTCPSNYESRSIPTCLQTQRHVGFSSNAYRHRPAFTCSKPRIHQRPSRHLQASTPLHTTFIRSSQSQARRSNILAW